MLVVYWSTKIKYEQNKYFLSNQHLHQGNTKYIYFYIENSLLSIIEQIKILDQDVKVEKD